MRGATYTILDEPQPGTLARFVVNPFWPLLAMMMAGTWLAGPWFILNAYALGSSTRRSETVLVLAAVASSAGMLFGFGYLADAYALSHATYPYARIVLAVVKLSFAYAIWLRQQRSIALYQYYGGVVRNGALPLIAGVIARGALQPASEWVQILFAI